MNRRVGTSEKVGDEDVECARNVEENGI